MFAERIVPSALVTGNRKVCQVWCVLGEQNSEMTGLFSTALDWETPPMRSTKGNLAATEWHSALRLVQP